jgi:hypothetical protein
MDAIRQQVHIAEDRRLRLNVDVTVPDHVPVGPAELTIVIAPLARRHSVEEVLSYAGCLAKSPLAEKGGLSVQLELRDEWN